MHIESPLVFASVQEAKPKILLRGLIQTMKDTLKGLVFVKERIPTHDIN